MKKVLILFCILTSLGVHAKATGKIEIKYGPGGVPYSACCQGNGGACSSEFTPTYQGSIAAFDVGMPCSFSMVVKPDGSSNKDRAITK